MSKRKSPRGRHPRASSEHSSGGQSAPLFYPEASSSVVGHKALRVDVMEAFNRTTNERTVGLSIQLDGVGAPEVAFLLDPALAEGVGQDMVQMVRAIRTDTRSDRGRADQ